MLTTAVVPPPIGGSRFLEIVAQPILDHFLQFACNCDGRCLQKTMGLLVELGIIVFGLEILVECSSAPPDNYQRSFKQFQKVSNSFKKFQTVSKSFKQFEKNQSTYSKDDGRIAEPGILHRTFPWPIQKQMECCHSKASPGDSASWLRHRTRDAASTLFHHPR